MKSKIKVLNEVPKVKIPNDWNLCFQYCRYDYDKKKSEYGYRFIWRDEKNNLRPQRGQARIPKFQNMKNLLDEAKKENWLEKIEKLYE